MGLVKRGTVWYWRNSYTPNMAKLLDVPNTVWISLKTKDRSEAEKIAKDQRLWLTHRRRLYAARYQLIGGLADDWKQRWFPRDGLYKIGEVQVVAAGDKLIFYNADGSIGKTYANEYKPTLAVLLKLSVEQGEAPPDVIAYYRKHFLKKAAAASDFNQQVFNAWLQKANPSADIRRDAKTVFDKYAEKFPDTPFKDLTKAEARQFLQDFIDAGLAPGTIQKKIGFLKSAINVAINDETMVRNPFSKLMDKAKTKDRRSPFSEDDMKIMLEKARLYLDAPDFTLFTLLHKTGMRMAEAWGIDREYNEDGIRYVIVGTKTDSSFRRIPLPNMLWFFNGPYQSGTPAAASKRINRFIKSCGIIDKAKVAHSFRHRAADRMRAFGVPSDHRKRILGHGEKDASEDYGLGFPMSELKPHIDRI
jgi:integrase